MKLSKWYIQLAGLAALGGLVTWVIGNYEILVPYRWERFTTTDGRVSLEFPSRAAVEDQKTLAAGAGPTPMHMVGTQTADGSYYGLSYGDAKGSEDKPPRELLDAARDGIVKNTNGGLISEAPIGVQGYPGRDIEARGRSNSFLDIRMVAVKGKVYVLGVASTSERSRDKRNIRKFFDSFRLLDM